MIINLGHMTFESVSDWSVDEERVEPEEDDIDIDDDGKYINLIDNIMIIIRRVLDSSFYSTSFIGDSSHFIIS